MRRILFTLVLALLVVCAQQGALLHQIGDGIGHGAANAPPLAGKAFAPAAGLDPGSTETDTYCDKCFAFAHVCGAAFSCAPDIALVLAASEPARGAEPVDQAASVPQPRSRGPPAVL